MIVKHGVHLSSIVADQAGENSSTTTEKERALLMTLFVAEEGKRAHRQHQTVGGIHHSDLYSCISVIGDTLEANFGPDFSYELGKEDVSGESTGQIFFGHLPAKRLVVVNAPLSESCSGGGVFRPSSSSSAPGSVHHQTAEPEAPTLKQPNSRSILHCANASVKNNAFFQMQLIQCLKLGVRHLRSLRIRRLPSHTCLPQMWSSAVKVLLRLLTPGARLAILKVAATAQPVDRQRQNAHAIDNGGGRGKLRWKQQQEKQEKMLAAQQPEGSQSTADDMKTYAEFEDYPVQGQRLYGFEPLAAERTEPYYATQLARLREMGFQHTYGQLVRQLQYAEGNVERAAHMLRQIAPQKDNEKNE
ncbi:hypothetical protein GPALN_006078 [Globodera pallida]|nr:hypothetical protein GPALN_006078 [Globodera pallida]